jgi:hypothetical protein
MYDIWNDQLFLCLGWGKPSGKISFNFRYVLVLLEDIKYRLTPIILTTWEAEIGRIEVQASLRK